MSVHVAKPKTSSTASSTNWGALLPMVSPATMRPFRGNPSGRGSATRDGSSAQACSPGSRMRRRHVGHVGHVCQQFAALVKLKLLLKWPFRFIDSEHLWISMTMIWDYSLIVIIQNIPSFVPSCDESWANFRAWFWSNIGFSTLVAFTIHFVNSYRPSGKDCENHQRESCSLPTASDHLGLKMWRTPTSGFQKGPCLS